MGNCFRRFANDSDRRSEQQPGTQPGQQSEPRSGRQGEPRPGRQGEPRSGRQGEPPFGQQPGPRSGSQSESPFGQQPGPRSKSQPGPQPRPRSGPRPGQQPGRQSEPHSGRKSEQLPESPSAQHPERRSGSRSEQQPGRKPGPRAEQQPARQPGVQLKKFRRVHLQAVTHFLEQMSLYLDAQNETLTLITVGGMTFRALLADLRAPHECDFLLPAMSDVPAQCALLQHAAAHAHSQSVSTLPVDCFSPRNMLLLPANTHDKVTRTATAQDQVLFRGKGLKVLAPPWDYAFSAMVRQIEGMQSRLIGDAPSSWSGDQYAHAAWYLHQYIQSHDGQPLRLGVIEAWPKAYDISTTQGLILRIVQEYDKRYIQGLVRV